MNFVKGDVVGVDGGITVKTHVGGSVTLPIRQGAAKVGDQVTLGVRPEHLSEQTGGGLQLVGDVDAVEHLGESSLVHMRLDDGAIVVMRTPGDSAATPGSRFTATAPAGAIHVFSDAGDALARDALGDLR